MLAWKDVLEVVGSTLANTAGDALLEFLRVLPEEVTEGRKINLSVRGTTTSSVLGHTSEADFSQLAPYLRIRI